MGLGMGRPVFGVGSAYGAARALSKAALALVITAGAALADPVRVAAFGDSLTHGFGLPPEDGFVPQLQAWLDAEGIEAEVLNAGVSGDTTAGGLARIEWTLAGDVDAMILELGANDFLRGIDPALSRENLRGIVAAAEAAGVEVLVVGIRSSSNYGAEYKAAFDAMFGEIAAEYGALYAEDFFAGLFAKLEDGGEMSLMMQADGLHPNATGVAAIVEGLGPDVAALIARATE